MFYPKEKPHMSPSSLASWNNSRSSFIKNYFEKAERVTTKAMEAGTMIHRLIEGGMMEAKRKYDINEGEVRVEMEGDVEMDGDVDFMGFPDSYTEEPIDGQARFVDYKSGKANNWEDKLPTDIKMRATAWLVWHMNDFPEEVVGEIEYIATTWDPAAKEVVPVEGAESEVIEYTYTKGELESFTEVIKKSVKDVNEFYEKWQDSSEDFINQDDISEYENLRSSKDKYNEEIDEEIDEVQEKIENQMKFGGISTYRGEGGTYSLREYTTYAYPEELKVNYDGEELARPEAKKMLKELKDAIKTAEKNYELASEPDTVKESISFRKKK
jgi:gas vesicle protein